MVNRTPSQVNQGKTPKELWSGNKPDFGHLKIFGCVAHAVILNPKKKKFDSKSKLCWLVGYDTHTKTYRLFNPRIKKIIFNQDVRFDEMHIGLDYDNIVSSLEQNTTKEEMDPSVSSFQKNITSNKNEHFN
jgi:hypothetical protein